MPDENQIYDDDGEDFNTADFEKMKREALEASSEEEEKPPVEDPEKDETPQEKEEDQEEDSGDADEQPDPSEKEKSDESAELKELVAEYKKKAADLDHLQAVAEKNPKGFKAIIEKYFPGLQDIEEPVDFPIEKVLSGEIEADEARKLWDRWKKTGMRSEVAATLRDFGLHDVVQEREEATLEKRFPFYREVEIKTGAKNYQKQLEVTPDQTLSEVIIKAAAFDRLAGLDGLEGKVKETLNKQKTAGTLEGDAPPPQEMKTKKKPTEREKLEDKAYASIENAHKEW